MATVDNLDTNVQMVDAGETLSTREKIGYGLGDAGGHCISDLISGFLLFSTPMCSASARPSSGQCSLP